MARSDLAPAAASISCGPVLSVAVPEVREVRGLGTVFPASYIHSSIRNTKNTRVEKCESQTTYFTYFTHQNCPADTRCAVTPLDVVNAVNAQIRSASNAQQDHGNPKPRDHRNGPGQIGHKRGALELTSRAACGFTKRDKQGGGLDALARATSASP
jgi:hypothetical protein